MKTKKIFFAIVVFFLVTQGIIAQTGLINSEKPVNLRSEKNTTSTALTTIPPNAEVKIIHKDAEWCKVEYKGQSGYVKTERLTIKETKNSINENKITENKSHVTKTESSKAEYKSTENNSPVQSNKISLATWGFLIGDWECQTANNNYYMKVSFNEKENKFEGVLIQQGDVSQKVGFTLGELCWTASQSNNAKILNVQQKWRYGGNGTSSSNWQNETLSMENCFGNKINTSNGAIFIKGAVQPDKGVLPNGTVIPIKFSKKVSSNDNLQPQAIVKSDVTDANGNILITSGTLVEIYPRKTSSEYNNGKGGNITVTFKYVKAVDGQYVYLSGDYTIEGKKAGFGSKLFTVNGKSATGHEAIISDTTTVTDIRTTAAYKIKVQK